MSIKDTFLAIYVLLLAKNNVRTDEIRSICFMKVRSILQVFGQDNIRNWLRQRLIDLLGKVLQVRRYLQGSGVTIRVYDLVNAGPRHRFATAQFIVHNCLGLGYGCGKAKFQTVAKTLADLDITDEQSEQMVNAFREGNPKICKLWRKLDEGFRRSVTAGVFEMELPSGRTMRYEDIRFTSKPYHDDKGKLRFRKVLTADIGGKRLPFYGGKLTENLVQSASRDVFGEHLSALDRAGLNTVFHVHDEAVVEAPKDADPRAVEEIMSVTPDWLPGCPIGAEAIESDHYKK